MVCIFSVVEEALFVPLQWSVDDDWKSVDRTRHSRPEDVWKLVLNRESLVPGLFQLVDHAGEICLKLSIQALTIVENRFYRLNTQINDANGAYRELTCQA